MTKEHSEVLKALLKPLEIDGDLDGILEIQGAALDEAQSDISYMEESIVPDILANEEIITRWEKLLEITSPFSTVFSERVDEIKRKLAIEGGINKDYFITLAEDLGFLIEIEKPKYFFRAGISRANDPAYDPMLNFMALAGDIDYGLIASSDRSDEYSHIQHNDNLKNNRVYSSSSSVRQYVFKVTIINKSREMAETLINTFLKLKPGFSFFEWEFVSTPVIGFTDTEEVLGFEEDPEVIGV